jgi:hypothetical protein
MAQLTASVKETELQLVKQAQEKYITDGKGNCSIRTMLLIGAKCILLDKHEN